MKRIIVAALAIVLAAACTENKKAEQTYPIGDRAFYEVAGNVECVDLEDVYQEFIFLGQKPEFNKEGQFFVNGIPHTICLCHVSANICASGNGFKIVYQRP